MSCSGRIALIRDPCLQGRGPIRGQANRELFGTIQLDDGLAAAEHKALAIADEIETNLAALAEGFDITIIDLMVAR